MLYLPQKFIKIGQVLFILGTFLLVPYSFISAETTTPSTQTVPLSPDTPSQPEVSSQVFLDPDTWYSKTEGAFTWTLPFDVSAMAIELSDNPENRPEENDDAIIDPPVEEFEVSSTSVKDGIQYISVNFKNQVGWGTVTNRKLMIDTTPPDPFAINVRSETAQTSFPRLSFQADDSTSGVQYYEVTVADKEPLRIAPQEARLGYLLKELEDDTYAVRVLAVDMAGNTRESSVTVLVTAGWVKPVEVPDKESFWNFLTPVQLFILLLMVIILLQIIFFWYEQRKIIAREEKLRRETREIQEQMEKIFSALRNEVYDQINAITKRKRLTNGEREAIEALAQALEVSETLIEKEINDVKAILK